jgi:ubiquitin C-terminal hydrolase
MRVPDVIDIGSYVDREMCSPPVVVARGRAGGRVSYSGQADTAPEFFEFSVDEDEKYEKRRGGFSTRYSLFSVLLHDGATIESGHFRMAVKERMSWRIYDDVRTSLGTFDPSSVYCAVYKSD